MNFVSYERRGNWDNTTDAWKFTRFDATYVEQPDWRDEEIPEYWEIYAHTMHCNESFWYVQ